MKKVAIILAIWLAANISTIQAQTKTPIVNNRQENQKERIKEGVQDGELTRKEAKDLKKDQKEIAIDKKIAKSDGKVTKKERAILDRKQDKASKEIYKKKHNDRNK